MSEEQYNEAMVTLNNKANFLYVLMGNAIIGEETNRIQKAIEILQAQRDMLKQEKTLNETRLKLFTLRADFPESWPENFKTE